MAITKPEWNHIDDALHWIISHDQARAIGALLSEVTEEKLPKNQAERGIEDIKKWINPAVTLDITNEFGDKLRSTFQRKKDD